MRNSKTVFFTLFFLFSFINILLAQFETIPQTRVSLYGGASLPQGEFAETSGEKGGYSETGFCGMFEISKPMGNSLNLLSSLSISLNSIDESAMEKNLSGLQISADSYITTWAMSGFGFELPASPTMRIYGLGQIGLLLSSFPDITLSYGGESITQTTDMGVAIAYGFGGGIILDKINIGLRYYHGEPEYEQSASYNGNSNSVKVKMPASLLELLFGINL